MFTCSGLDEGLPCSYFHETNGLTESQRIERSVFCLCIKLFGCVSEMLIVELFCIKGLRLCFTCSIQETVNRMHQD